MISQDPKLDALYTVLKKQITDHPVMQARDVYKLLYQAALGSEHAGLEERSARQRLERELSDMGPGPDDPLFEPISPDGQMVRVHLRPYIRAGMEPEVLLHAFVRTANEWRGSLDTLRSYGKSVAQLADAKHWSFSRVEFENFFIDQEAQGFPAVHHSAAYLKAYKPAYRVLLKRFLEAA